jgi:hypothetical protein
LQASNDIRNKYVWGRALASVPANCLDYRQLHGALNGDAGPKSKGKVNQLPKQDPPHDKIGIGGKDLPVASPASSFESFSKGLALLLADVALQRDLLELLCIVYCKSEAFISKKELNLILATHSSLQHVGIKAKNSVLRKVYEGLDRPSARDGGDKYRKRNVIRALAAAGVDLKIEADALLADAYEQDYEGKLLYLLSLSDPLITGALSPPSAASQVFGWSTPPFGGEQDAPLLRRPLELESTPTKEVSISATKLAGRSRHKMQILENELILRLGNAILDDCNYSSIDVPTREYKTPYLHKRALPSKTSGWGVKAPSSSLSGRSGVGGGGGRGAGADARSLSPLAGGASAQRTVTNRTSPQRSRPGTRSSKQGLRGVAVPLGRSFLTEIAYAAELQSQDVIRGENGENEISSDIDVEDEPIVITQADVKPIVVSHVEDAIEPTQLASTPVNVPSAESPLNRIKSFIGIRKSLNVNHSSASSPPGPASQHFDDPVNVHAGNNALTHPGEQCGSHDELKEGSQSDNVSNVSATTPLAHRVSFPSESEEIIKKNYEKRVSKTAPSISSTNVAVTSPIPSQPIVSHPLIAIPAEPQESGRDESKQQSLAVSIDDAKITTCIDPKGASADEEMCRGQNGFLGGLLSRFKRK